MNDAPKTADRHNVESGIGRAEILRGGMKPAKARPAAAVLPPAAKAPAASNSGAVSLSLKDTRQGVIDGVNACQTMPVEDRAAIVARINRIPEQHKLIKVDFHGHPHGVGFNWHGTVDKI